MQRSTSVSQDRSQSSTDSGEKNGLQVGVGRVRLPDLPRCVLGQEGDAVNAFNATDEQFLAFIGTIAPLELGGEGLDHWTYEERRDFLNYCLDEGILHIEDGRLVPTTPDAEKGESSYGESSAYQYIE